MAGQFFVISAPSGAGKSTLIRNVRERVDRLGYSVSHTTRKPRGGEQDGTHYHFVDVETFTAMRDQGKFIEWARVYDDYYGTSYASLEEQTALDVDVLLDLDPQGAKNIRKRAGDSVLIYVLPPSLEILEDRLRARGTDSERVIQGRLEKARAEIQNCVFYDHIIINDSLDRAAGEVEAVIVSERSRAGRRLPAVADRFGLPAS
jgi:guanylate kinase